MNIQKTINSINPITLAEILFKKEKRLKTFLSLPIDDRISMLHRVTLPIRRELLNRLSDDDIVSIIKEVEPDSATDFLQLLNNSKRERALGLLSSSMRDSLSKLLAFDADTAAGLMTLDYIQISKTDSMTDVAEKLRNHEQKTGRLPEILVIDEDKLIGYLPVHQLGLSNRKETAAPFVKHIITIEYSANQSKVIDTFKMHPHSKVAVVDDSYKPVGIIYSDDVIRLIEGNKASSLYGFAGVSNYESVSDNAKSKVKFRYKWLIINLATAFFAAYTVGLFESTISKYVLLAVYMPIVAGMGGNAATQTLAVLVRGIALKQITLRTMVRTLKNELGAGLINGLITGLIVSLVVIIKDGNFSIAIILAVAMVANLCVAGFFGTITPLIMNKLKKDPASSATIFITTATDVIGFFVFLGLASLILK